MNREFVRLGVGSLKIQACKLIVIGVFSQSRLIYMLIYFTPVARLMC